VSGTLQWQISNKKEDKFMENKQKVTTGKVRFSYANVWRPKSINGGEEKYSLSVIIDKNDKQTLKLIQDAIKEAEKAGISKFGAKFTSGAGFKRPLRDGDIDRSDDPNYKDSFFVNANSTSAPGIIDKRKMPILEQSEFYSGCYGRVSLMFYPFSASGNKGIACGLQNIQKLEDGEPLGGRSRAEDDFDDISGEEDDLLS
jgi:hypothetical protein